MHYTLDIEISPIQQTGNQTVSCVGFLLEKRKNHDFEIKGGMFGMMMMFGGLGLGPKPQVDLRESLLRKSDNVGHLFSTARYNFKLQELSFYLCKDLFDEYGDYYVSLVRTDCWGTLNHDMVKLKQAKCLSLLE